MRRDELVVERTEERIGMLACKFEEARVEDNEEELQEVTMPSDGWEEEVDGELPDLQEEAMEVVLLNHELPDLWDEDEDEGLGMDIDDSDFELNFD